MTTKIYAVAPDVVPVRARRYITPGKRYEVKDCKGVCFNIKSDDEGDMISCLWHKCPHLGGGNWTRLDVDDTDAPDVATLFAEKIKAGRYVAPSAITARLASEIVGRGLASEAQMRAAGFRL